ncbi:hypothetical protein DF046_06955 [Burkholderia cepacia]|nr:hypothetical protein DF050_21780 [Burkholderia cepacia]RQT59530.1 hypothetical protein DF046_06955 [Burkholderia cepacia]
MVRTIGFRMLLSVLRLQGPLSAWTDKARLASSKRVVCRVRRATRAAAPGWGTAGTKRQSGWEDSTGARNARAGARRGRRRSVRPRPGQKRARRGRPVSRRRAARGRVAYQLPAIVSTGLNVPRSTL